ncbi:MAG: hypothetical protein J6J12_02605 [Oscillospiraceae bacterium]|nr:hypothetical protein [Oscillospiraceae bacterium]
MNAPNLWQQLLIAFLGIVSLPAVITILGKIHLLPLAVYLLAAYSFPLWVSDNPLVSTALLIATVLYPVLVWGGKAVQWWQEEQYLRGRLLATATPLNSAEDVLEPQENNWYDECDW